MTDLIVRTVLGDIPPDSLGPLDYHEHLFQTSPLLPGDELQDEQHSSDEASSLVQAGISAIIEATPTGLGRNAAATARISAATGLTVVHTTGAHHSGHYAPDSPVLNATVDELADLFTSDITMGLADGGVRSFAPNGAPVRAGLAKAGIQYWRIGPFEMRVIEAVARAHAATGCALMIHLDYGSAAHEVLDLLASFEVPTDRVVLAHIDRNLDPALHLDLAQRGAYLGYDGMARHREAPDSSILQCLNRVVSGGGVERLLLGGDVARSSRYLAYGGMPGLCYLPRRFLPRLKTEVGADATETILVRNGSRLLSMPPR